MAALTPPVCDFDWPAPNFTLSATDGQTYTLADIAGPKGTLIMFICNHCPFVLAILDRILRDGVELQGMGIGVAAICSNDPVSYPEDNFANMTRMAQERAFPSPTFTTSPKTWPAPMKRCARQISSVSMRTWDCNTGVGWMPPGCHPRPLMRRETCSMRWQ